MVQIMKNIAKVLSVFVLLFVSAGWGETPGGPRADGSGVFIGGAPDGNSGIGGAAGQCCYQKNAVDGDRDGNPKALAAEGHVKGPPGTDSHP